MMKYNVPFYPNTPDDTHCYQAALRSVLQYFLPEKEYTWQELEEMTAKKEGLWTWPTQGLISLHKLGFEVKDIGLFDIEEFVKDGGEYLEKEYGKDVANEQIKHSDIPQEQELYREFLQYNVDEKRLPSLEDIKKMVEEGYLVICNVNAKVLNGKNGYVGHFVVVTGFDDDSFYLHDPGLPPMEDRKVSFEAFVNAWEYPNEKARNAIGLKYRIGIESD